MTPQIAQLALTEDEIRQAIAESVGGGYVDVDNTTVMLKVVTDSDMARVRVLWSDDFTPQDTHPGTLWADMRPEEFEELSDTMYDIQHAVEREATQMLIERATAAAVAFAAKHPDVPRGHWPLRKAAAE
jgi:hypothetical protein